MVIRIPTVKVTITETRSELPNHSANSWRMSRRPAAVRSSSATRLPAAATAIIVAIIATQCQIRGSRQVRTAMRGSTIAHAGPMQKVKTHATRNAASVSRQGVCRDTPENAKVATRAGATKKATLRARLRENRFIERFSLLVTADAAEA